jgi:chromosome segregation ATPase
MDNESVHICSTDDPITRLIKDTWATAHGYQHDGKGRTAEEILRDFTSAILTGDPTGTAKLEEQISGLEWDKDEAERELVEAKEATDDLRGKVRDIQSDLVNQLGLIDKLGERVSAADPKMADLVDELEEIMTFTRELVDDLRKATED